jgi:hypothetical protein
VSIEGIIEQSGQLATVTAEAPRGVAAARTAMGGADRSDAAWLTVADGVPCLVSPSGSSLDRRRNDAREDAIEAEIYFARDPAPGGLNTRHRVSVTGTRTGGDPVALGVYVVTGVVDPNYLGRLFVARAERIRVP